MDQHLFFIQKYIKCFKSGDCWWSFVFQCVSQNLLNDEFFVPKNKYLNNVRVALNVCKTIPI